MQGLSSQVPAADSQGRYIFWSGFLFVLCLMLTAYVGMARAARKPSPREPVRIQSDRMETIDKKGNVVFKGHVRASRGDLVIHSDVLKVYYRQVPGREGKRLIDRLVAEGNVKITKNERMATGKKAVYNKPEEKIILTGNAQVWDGRNRIRGDKIVFFVNEDRSIVESSGSHKVEAVVYPED